MSDPLVEQLRTHAPIGTRVVISLTQGGQLEGTIAEISDEFVKVAGPRGLTVVRGSMIGCWILQEPNGGASTQAASAPLGATHVGPELPASPRLVEEVPPDRRGRADSPAADGHAAGGGFVATGIGAPTERRAPADDLPEALALASRAGAQAASTPAHFQQLVRIGARLDLQALLKANASGAPNFRVACPSELSFSQRTDLLNELSRAENHFRSGLRVGEQRRCAESARVVQALRARFPDLPQLASLHAEVLRVAGAAEQAADAALDAWREGRTEALAIRAATLAACCRDFETALAILAEQCDRAPDGLSTPAAELLIALADHTDRHGAVAKLLAGAPTRVAAIAEGLAYVAAKLGDSAIAGDLLGRPADPEVHGRLRRLLAARTVSEPALPATTGRRLLRPTSPPPDAPATTAGVDAKVESAVQAARSGGLNEALDILREVLRASPRHDRARTLVTIFEERIRRGPSTHRPTQKKRSAPAENVYQRAKRLHTVERDLEAAQRLYREAIEQNVGRESAIKDLAYLLDQVGRRSEAVELMRTWLPQMANQLSALNTLSHLCQLEKRHDEALAYLDRVLSLQRTTADRVRVLKRKAYSHVALGRYVETEKLLENILRLAPRDEVALRWKKALAEGHSSGNYAEVMKFALENFEDEPARGVQLSPLFRWALENCRYEGVAERVRAARTFTEETLRSVDAQIDVAGRSRPALRAQYLLTTARLMRDLESEDHSTFHSRLVRFALSMGDASCNEVKDPDVIRTYYAEAVSIAQEWPARHVSRYLVSFALPQNKLLEWAIEDHVRIAHAIVALFRPGEDRRAALEGILHLLVTNQNGSVLKHLVPSLYEHDAARAASLMFLRAAGVVAEGDDRVTLDQFRAAWGALREKRFADWDEITGRLAEAASMPLDRSSLDLRWKELDSLGAAWLCKLDRERLRSLRDALEQARNLFEGTDFQDRERSYFSFRQRLEQLLTAIQSDPTRLSVSSLLPLATHWLSEIETRFGAIVADTSPAVTIELPVAVVAPDKHGECILQVQAGNGPGCQPVRHLTATFDPTPGIVEIEPSPTNADFIRGGDSAILEFRLRLAPSALEAKVVPLTMTLGFRDRRDEAGETARREFSLGLYSIEDFEPLPNRFAPIVESGEVRDPSMFYGRERELDRIIASLVDQSAKCVVLYGQKRAGKSSVLLHLQNRLNDRPDVIAVKFSLGDIALDKSASAMLLTMATELAEAIRTLRERDQASSLPEPPAIVPAEFRREPAAAFRAFLDEYRRSLRAAGGGAPPRTIVFLIDEFTYLYTWIEGGSVSGDFMKLWKSLIERGLFHAVLVGQDVMPRFKSKFPNEFGVTEDIRLTYLSEDDTRRLLDEPTRVAGTLESRFKARAMRRALEVTAGSPYYTQMLGNRLVEYMNRRRLKYITESDVNKVVESMVVGPQSLTEDKFDPLFTAGDAATSPFPKEHVRAILSAIAAASQAGACSIGVVRELGIGQADEIVRDLEAREVVRSPRPGFVQILVALFQEWLLKHD